LVPRLTSIATYRSSRELFANLTLRELRSRYKRSVLGWTWSLINPLAMVLVYTLVFKYFLKVKVSPGEPSGLNVWALFLMCALLPWNYFQIAVNSSISSLVSNAGLIKKTYFPRELLPASSVASAFVTHLIEMGLLLVALLGFGNWRALIFVPLVLVLSIFMAIFALGLGLALSSLNVYFRDIEHFMGIFFLVWMFTTPILYPIYAVPAHFQTLLKLNPMTDATLSYRAMLYDGTLPGGLQVAYFVVWALAAFVVGLWVFNRFERDIAEEL
jgi:ABC-type polysaccharide/polyol phosphate export permease